MRAIPARIARTSRKVALGTSPTQSPQIASSASRTGPTRCMHTSALQDTFERSHPRWAADRPPIDFYGRYRLCTTAPWPYRRQRSPAAPLRPPRLLPDLPASIPPRSTIVAKRCISRPLSTRTDAKLTVAARAHVHRRLDAARGRLDVRTCQRRALWDEDRTGTYLAHRHRVPACAYCQSSSDVRKGSAGGLTGTEAVPVWQGLRMRPADDIYTT
ncbi:hypothetical protein VTO73DRAFT_11686 [Trametes versicolor]